MSELKATATPMATTTATSPTQHALKHRLMQWNGNVDAETTLQRFVSR